MSSPAPDDKRALPHHLETLYALARVLAGSDDADALVQTVYTQAAKVPPDQRPSDIRGWLFRLMLETKEGDLPSSGAQVHPGTDTSFTDDPFRREVAEQTANRMLPVAFAACSIHERFILSIDVLGDPSDEVLAAALDTSVANARSVRDQARSALRASLRDVLTGPERMLVDVALPDEALRRHLRELLLDRFHPPPTSLRASITERLERARTARSGSAGESEQADENAVLSPAFPLPERVVEALDWIQDRISLRGLIGGLAFLLVVSAGIGGGRYFLDSSSPPKSSPPPSIVDVSAQRAGEVPLALNTENPTEAAAFIRQTWGRRVSVPTLDGASLQGVGRLSLSPDVEVPALLYNTPAGSTVVALVFNYALVDRLGTRAQLPREVRSRLAANDSLLTKQRKDQAVVLWRQRDDILVLVAPNTDADKLRSRIEF